MFFVEFYCLNRCITLRSITFTKDIFFHSLSLTLWENHFLFFIWGDAFIGTPCISKWDSDNKQLSTSMILAFHILLITVVHPLSCLQSTCTSLSSNVQNYLCWAINHVVCQTVHKGNIFMKYKIIIWPLHLSQCRDRADKIYFPTIGMMSKIFD